MICLKRTIQGPGFGSQRVHTGTSVRMSQGRAMPRPSARNTAEAVTVLCVTAYPSAAPIKGAVQGDATTTASTPVQKLPAGPVLGSSRAARLSARWLAAVNSKVPMRFIVIAVKRSAKTATTHGLCS